jgi:hypothetical protein
VAIRGFNNPVVAKGSTWEIGSENNYSNLELNWPGLGDIDKFTADDGKIPNVIFRTKRYTSWDEVINSNSKGT